MNQDLLPEKVPHVIEGQDLTQDLYRLIEGGLVTNHTLKHDFNLGQKSLPRMSRLTQNSKSSVILGKVVCNLTEGLNPKKTRNELINSGRKHLNTYQNKVDLQIKRSQIEVTKNDWC